MRGVAALRCSREAAYCEATLAYTAPPPLLLPVAPPHTGLIDEKRQIYKSKHSFIVHMYLFHFRTNVRVQIEMAVQIKFVMK